MRTAFFGCPKASNRGLFCFFLSIVIVGTQLHYRFDWVTPGEDLLPQTPPDSIWTSPSENTGLT